MVYKSHLLKEAIIDLQDQAEHFNKEKKCGEICVKLSVFMGGLTGKKLLIEETQI